MEAEGHRLIRSGLNLATAAIPHGLVDPTTHHPAWHTGSRCDVLRVEQIDDPAAARNYLGIFEVEVVTTRLFDGLPEIVDNK